jgi:hypothetical protein
VAWYSLMMSKLPVKIIKPIFSLVLILSVNPAAFWYSNSPVLATQSIQANQMADLWVDALHGNDENNGLSRLTAYRTIQRAANVATPGTTVHILPGIYRETIKPTSSGKVTQPMVYRSEEGPGTVVIRGSQEAATLEWTQLISNSIGLPDDINPGNLYYADLSSWKLNAAPRFVIQFNSNNEATRLPLAREPDWQVSTDWKYAEYWWTADGGASLANCDPSTDPDPDCDIPSRSTTQLIDHQSDPEQAGIEAGNLTTLGNLTGATLVALDDAEGHYLYHRTIIAHAVTQGRITVDRACEFDAGSGLPGLGWGSKYYIENHPALIDTAGEWWYDANHSRLYLWPLTPGNPAAQHIEISQREAGFDLTNLSYITLDGLSIEIFNGSAIFQMNNEHSSSYANTVRNASIRFTNFGISLGQSADGQLSDITSGFTLEDSTISHIDSLGFYTNYWWVGGTVDTFTHAGIINTKIRNNEFFDLGFNPDSDYPDGIQINYPDRFYFENNYVHQIAHNGIILGRSIIQSVKDRGFSSDEIKTGNILIKDNIIEKACLLATDCGALKLVGRLPDNHVFRDMLVMGNVFRNNFGWTYISEKRGTWAGGPGSEVQGMGAFGIYLDGASGIYAYRNIAYNNSSSGFHLYSQWWDGNIILINNILANSVNGIWLNGNATPTSVNTQISNNIIINNEGFGILMARGDAGNVLIDNNLYDNNGWRAYADGGFAQPGDISIGHPNTYYQTLADIQSNTAWESNGVEGDPSFWDYDYSDHDIFDNSWPDFHPKVTAINVIDKGTLTLPISLAELLDQFKILDPQRGQAYDIGRYEAGFSLITQLIRQSISTPGSVQYSLQLDPADLPYRVTLTADSPDPRYEISLSSSAIALDGAVSLTIRDKGSRTNGLPTLESVLLIASGGDFLVSSNIIIPIGMGNNCSTIFPPNVKLR